ncbi:unnamed protein product, partial [Polarella glacialis]
AFFLPSLCTSRPTSSPTVPLVARRAPGSSWAQGPNSGSGGGSSASSSTTPNAQSVGLCAAAAAAAGLSARHSRRQDAAAAARCLVVRQAKAYRMPLPPNVDEVQPPRWQVLMDAVENCSVEKAVIPTWKLKPMLGINSPTPQYAPLHYIEPKPYWVRAAFIKRKQKAYYNKMLEKRMELDGYKLRYLPNAKDRLYRTGTQILGGIGSFKVQGEAWKSLSKMSANEILEAMSDQRTVRLGLATKDIPLNWRPGYQTAAIRDMKDHLKRVDVIVEVRDARIPWATTHPDIPEWVRPKPRVIVLTRADLIPAKALEDTIAYIKMSERDRGVPVVAVDAQRGGDGIENLREELMKAGAYVNRRRKRKGVNPRAVRTMTIGFPNVGKSSIINCLAHRKVAKRTNWAGATRRLTWHKIGGFRNTELEFLDSPGLIPVGFGKRYTDEQAALLCMCRIFGEKIIDRQQTAYDLVNRIYKLSRESPHMVDKTVWKETQRIYKVDFLKAVKQEGPFLPEHVPTKNPEPWCGKVLNEFQCGYWGKIQLESPPSLPEKAKDWSPMLKGSTQTTKHIEGVQIRGALGAGRAEIQMPVKGEDGREKVPVLAGPQRRPDNLSAEGLFDGW